MPFGMISKREDQLLADEGPGRLTHERTLGRARQLVKPGRCGFGLGVERPMAFRVRVWADVRPRTEWLRG